jgi:hypothetical protein
VYRGVSLAATPFHLQSSESNASANETHAGFTTTVGGCEVVLCVGNGTNDIAVDTQSTTSPGTLSERGEKTSMGGTD